MDAMVLLEDTRASLLVSVPLSFARPLRLGADLVTVSTCNECLAASKQEKNGKNGWHRERESSTFSFPIADGI